jgi:hypothetical protein
MTAGRWTPLWVILAMLFGAAAPAGVVVAATVIVALTALGWNLAKESGRQRQWNR